MAPLTEVFCQEGERLFGGNPVAHAQASNEDGARHIRASLAGAVQKTGIRSLESPSVPVGILAAEVAAQLSLRARSNSLHPTAV